MVFATIKKLPLHQLFVATLVGVLSGVYIFKPLFLKKDQNVTENLEENKVFAPEN